MILPSAAPFIFTGLRIGIGLSWLAIVAAEMLMVASGSASSSRMLGTARTFQTSFMPGIAIRPMKQPDANPRSSTLFSNNAKTAWKGGS